MIRALLAATAALLLAPAAAPAFITGFQTRDVMCAYLSFEGKRSLRCDLTSKATGTAPKPAWCEFDYGLYFGLTPRGKARRLCVSDTPMDPSFETLALGGTWKRREFTCRLRASGLRCTNARRHGFRLTRTKQTLF